MVDASTIIIGLTGSFGSGCSTLRKVLEESFGFQSFKLSAVVRETVKSKKLDENNRQVLQSEGDLLRKEKGNGFLAIAALEKAMKTDAERIIFHGIRNVGEIKELRKYPNFYLVAVDCSFDSRWERLRDIYKDDLAAFISEDKRDKDEELPYGQQVLRCVENADIVFTNDENYETKQKTWTELCSRFNTLLGLITGEKLRNPSIAETMMTVASSLALRSHCIKRRVGAVLCDDTSYIISAAYNEVPLGQAKCLDQYGKCYRDVVRDLFKNDFFKKLSVCFSCREPLQHKVGVFICEHCGHDHSGMIPPYKALDKCRSLHAEEAAILKAAHYHIKEASLYTTTFPCLQCAKRILHAGIKRVVYIDPYPEKESIEMLEKGGVHTEKFEGVKAQAYYKLFHPYQEFLENQTAKV